MTSPISCFAVERSHLKSPRAIFWFFREDNTSIYPVSLPSIHSSSYNPPIIHLFNCPSTHPSVHPPIQTSIHPFIHQRTVSFVTPRKVCVGWKDRTNLPFPFCIDFRCLFDRNIFLNNNNNNNNNSNNNNNNNNNNNGVTRF